MYKLISTSLISQNEPLVMEICKEIDNHSEHIIRLHQKIDYLARMREQERLEHEEEKQALSSQIEELVLQFYCSAHYTPNDNPKARMVCDDSLIKIKQWQYIVVEEFNNTLIFCADRKETEIRDIDYLYKLAYNLVQ